MYMLAALSKRLHEEENETGKIFGVLCDRMTLTFGRLLRDKILKDIRSRLGAAKSDRVSADMGSDFRNFF